MKADISTPICPHNNVSCVYHACMSDHCQFSVCGPILGISRRCGLPLIDRKLKRKYNLHYRVRRQGFQLHTPLQTIFLKPNTLPSSSCIKLRDEYHYSIQTLLF